MMCKCKVIGNLDSQWGHERVRQVRLSALSLKGFDTLSPNYWLAAREAARLSVTACCHPFLRTHAFG
jgi:hypothetical protein